MMVGLFFFAYLSYFLSFPSYLPSILSSFLSSFLFLFFWQLIKLEVWEEGNLK